VQMIIIYKQ